MLPHMAKPSDMVGAPRDLSITDRELLERLTWFTHVRWVFGMAALVTLLVSWYGLGLRLRTPDGTHSMAPAVRVVLAMFLYNALFVLLSHIVRTRQRVTRRLLEGLALGQFGCDLIAISALIHYTGGVENSFVFIILVPLVIVTELLPQPLAYATAFAAAGLFNALAWCEQQGVIDHISVERASGQVLHALNVYKDPLHVLHVTGAVTATIFAIVFVASTIAARLRQREKQLEAAHRQLHTANEAKTFFLRKAGHEMRAPLGAIHSILDAITEVPGTLSDQQRKIIARAKHRAQAMILLVNDLLKFSRLRAPEDVLAFRRVALHEIVCNTAELMRDRAAGGGIELRCQAEPVYLWCDEEQMRELVTNLVANAIQYTPAGGRVEVSLQKQPDAAVLEVADTGIGIAPEARARIFEEFYRTTEAKERFKDGTGLGLAIVQRIVQLHGGQIRIDENPGGGTIFTIQLPSAAPAETS